MEEEVVELPYAEITLPELCAHNPMTRIARTLRLECLSNFEFNGEKNNR